MCCNWLQTHVTTMLMLCSVLRLAAYIRGTGAKTRWAFVERLILCHQRSVAGFFFDTLTP